MGISVMQRECSQLRRNAVVDALWSLKYSLLGLPLIGYGFGNMPGALVGGAVLTGMGAGLGGLALWLKHSVSKYEASQAHLRGLCPHCLRRLEGRQVCSKCQQELDPVAYLPGIQIARYCPACSTLLQEAPPAARCFSPGCGPGKELLGFGGKRGIFAVAIRNLDLDLPGGWKPRVEATGAEEYFHITQDRAVLLRVITDRRFSGDALPPAAWLTLEHIWVDQRSAPGAILVLENVCRGTSARVTFEASREELGQVSAQFPSARFGLDFSLFLKQIAYDPI